MLLLAGMNPRSIRVGLAAGLLLAGTVVAGLARAELPWICVANCPGPGPLPPPPPDPEAQRRAAGEAAKKDGLAAYRAGNWAAAVRQLREALRLLPNDAQVLAHLREAERQFQLAALQNQANAALDARDWDSAIAALEAALKLAPDDGEPRQQLRSTRGLRANDEGLRRLGEGDLNGALSAFADALKYRPGDGVITKNRDRTLDRMHYESWKRENERLARERAERDAKQKAAQNAVERIIDTRAGQEPGRVGVSLDSIAARQAELSRNTGLAAKRADDFSDFNKPWDTRGPLDGSVVDARPRGGMGTADRGTPPSASLPAAAKPVQQRIDALARQSAELEGRITRETDPVKRGELINKQTAVRSEQRAEEIKLVDILVRPPGAAAPPAPPAPARTK
jgi:tetratricopeptide (TPR) repeat protein